ncbi:GntR family transcriptional regulator, partial [Streptococcus pneumoniae]
MFASFLELCYTTIRILYKYTMNEQLPDEMTLAKQFACSRMTIKKALDLLVSEGLIFRKRGQGTFVLSRGSSKRKLIVPE